MGVGWVAMVAVGAAYGDESFHEHSTHGFYVLSGVVFPPEVLDDAREVLRDMRGSRRVDKLHWHEMDVSQQCQAAKQLADLDGLHIVTTGSPVPRRRQERARAQCLTRLVSELSGYQVTRLCLEARPPELNRRDVRTVTGARKRILPKGTEFQVEHDAGSSEPLLWAADIIAGACRSAREGHIRPRRLLDERIYEVFVDTRC